MAPRITPELWDVLKPFFLGVFLHSVELGRYEDHLYGFFAFALLHEDLAIDPVEAQAALRVGAPQGRSHVAWYWWRQVDSATDYGATLFRERLKYLLTHVWPIDHELRAGDSSGNLARLAICCGSEFEDAVATIAPLLTKLEKPHEVIWVLKETDRIEVYPAATVILVDAVIGDQIERWAWPDLRSILDRLSKVRPDLDGDDRFVRLSAVLHQFE